MLPKDKMFDIDESIPVKQPSKVVETEKQCSEQIIRDRSW